LGDRLNAHVKAKGKHVEHLLLCVCNCQFVITFNACITVVMNSLTHAIIHTVMYCHLLGEVYNFVTILLQIRSGICLPKTVKIERDLTKLLRT